MGEIRSAMLVQASAETVHRLLTTVEAWRVWSPHIAWVDPPNGHVAAGWRGRVKAWFAPAPTGMEVTWAEPSRGMDWQSRALGHRLLYAQRIVPEGGACRVTFVARVEGPLGGAVTRLSRPLSALGQRRRLRRLAALAELQEGSAGR